MSPVRRWLVAGLVAGAVLRAAVLPLAGTTDVVIWKTWAYGASADLPGAYGVGGQPPAHTEVAWQTRHFAVDYPPLTLEELAVTGMLYRRIDAAFEDSRTLDALVKLPGVMWEVFFVTCLLTWGRRRWGPDIAARAALAWWLNPAVVINGPLLGYLDTAMLVPAAMSLLSAWDGSLVAAAVLASLAMLTKAQAVFVLPAIGVAAWHGARERPRAWVWALLAAALLIGLALLPFALRGTLPNLIAGVDRLGAQDILSGYAANAWWLVTWALRVQDMLPEWGWTRSLLQETHILAISSVQALGYPNPRLIGMALVAIAFSWGVWRARRMTALADVTALAGWCACAYVMFATQVHENHLALALPFVGLAAALDRRWRWSALAVTLIAALNLVLFYGWGTDAPVVIPRQITGVDLSVILAVANVMTFSVYTWQFGARHAPGTREATRSRLPIHPPGAEGVDHQGIFERFNLMHDGGGNRDDLAGSDRQGRLPVEHEAQGAIEDERHLLAGVPVARDERAALEPDLRHGLGGAGHHFPLHHFRDAFERQLVPTDQLRARRGRIRGDG